MCEKSHTQANVGARLVIAMCSTNKRNGNVENGYNKGH